MSAPREPSRTVVRRVFEEDAYADRAFRERGRRARRARPGVRDAARLRHRAARPDARPRDRDARAAAGAQARPAGARGPPARRLPARLHGRRPGARRRGRVGGARAARGARARGRVHERRAAAALGGPSGGAEPPARGDPRRGGALHSYPDWVAETWWRELGRRGRAALMRRAERAAGDGRARRRRGPKVVDAIPPDWVASGYAWPQSRGSQLAGPRSAPGPGERVLDLCAAPGGKATQLAAAGAEVVAVEKHPGRARELEENARRLGVGTHGRQRGRARPARRPGRVRPRARRRAVLGPRRPQLAARTSAGAPSRCPTSSSRSCARRSSACARAGRSPTRSAP